MKKILSTVCIILGLLLLLYGSVKLARAEEQGETIASYEGEDYSFTNPDESRGTTAVNVGIALTAVGAISLFFFRSKPRD